MVIHKDLLSDDDQARIRAAEYMIQNTSPDDTESLVDLLEQESKIHVAWRLVEALGRIGEPGAIPALRSSLERGQVNLASEAILALERIGTEDALAALARGLHLSDSYLSGKAAEALIRIGKPSVQHIHEYLSDTNPTIMIRAIEVLSHIADERSEKKLIAIMKSGMPNSVRCEAVYALGSYQTAESEAVLKEALLDSSTDESLRRAAAYALRNYHTATAAAALGKALEEESKDVRGSAVYAMLNMPIDITSPYVLQALKSQHEEVRHIALKIVGEYRFHEASELIPPILREHGIDLPYNFIKIADDVLQAPGVSASCRASAVDVITTFLENTSLHSHDMRFRVAAEALKNLATESEVSRISELYWDIDHTICSSNPNRNACLELVQLFVKHPTPEAMKAIRLALNSRDQVIVRKARYYCEKAGLDITE